MPPEPITDLDDVADALGLTDLRAAVDDVKAITVEVLRRLDVIAARLGLPRQPEQPAA